MGTAILVTGDDFKQPIQLTLDDVNVSVPTLAVVKAAVVSIDHSAILSDVVDVPITNTGSNWTTGLIVVEIGPTVTALISTYGPANLEIQVDDDGNKMSWFVPIAVIKGLVD